jgi:hypothetical protein
MTQTLYAHINKRKKKKSHYRKEKKKKAGGVAQGVVPEFTPQHQKKKKEAPSTDQGKEWPTAHFLTLATKTLATTCMLLEALE